MMMWKKYLGAGFVIALAATACGGNEVAETTNGSNPVATTAPVDPAPTTPSTGFDNQEIPSQLESVTAAWETDFSKAVVDLDELLVGIPIADPRDAIPPIDSPAFKSVGESEWISDREPGVLIEIEGDARFYPLSIMTRHEIVNDEVGGIPVAVTYCPLCNTAVAFDRRFNGAVLRLGVSGLLRNSDLVMWDGDTQSLWQQVTGEAIVGTQAGQRLTPIPTAIVSWGDFAANHGDGSALSDDQGFGIPYGRNPYEFYSSRSSPFAFFDGEIDPRFPALERVVGLTIGETSKAYGFPDLQEARVVNDVVDGEPIVVLWGSPDTADGLDASTIAEARPVGTGIAYSSVVDGATLTFEPDGNDQFRDTETGTTWNILGVAIAGDLAGQRLDLVTHRNEFWFAWHAFFPEAEVWESSAQGPSAASVPDPAALTVEISAKAAGAISTKPLKR